MTFLSIQEHKLWLHKANKVGAVTCKILDAEATEEGVPSV
jgi:hypothetical protein